MKWTLNVVAALLVLGTVGCATASSGWDEASSSEMKSEAQWLLHAIDSGNVAGMIEKLDTDAIAFDLNDKNQPVHLEGDGVKEYFRSMGSAMTSGLKFTSTLQSAACHATPAVGFCAIEFEQSVTSGGQTMGPFKYRGTLVARKVGGAWRWTHWHGSFAALPAGVA